jgi:hypothetical protein
MFSSLRAGSVVGHRKIGKASAALSEVVDANLCQYLQQLAACRTHITESYV